MPRRVVKGRLNQWLLTRVDTVKFFFLRFCLCADTLRVTGNGTHSRNVSERIGPHGCVVHGTIPGLRVLRSGTVIEMAGDLVERCVGR